MLIVGLILVWGVVLLPDLVARISRGRRSDGIRSFNTQLSSLGRSNTGRSNTGRSNAGSSTAVRAGDNVIDLRSRASRQARSATSRSPGTGGTGGTGGTKRLGSSAIGPHPVSAAVRKRRQDVLVTLGSASVLTLLATVAFGGPVLYVHLLVDVLLAVYLILLVQVGATQPMSTSATRRVGCTGHSRGSLAPLGPLDALRTGSVGEATPMEPRRIANRAG